MATSIPALVNPPLLIWARKESKYSLDQAADRMGIAAAKLQSWESGEARPTLRQAEKLAALYRRPYSVFCLATLPSTPPLAAEYRRLPGVKPGAESPELRVALREMIYRRQVALRLLDEVGDGAESFALRATLKEDPIKVAERLRETLHISSETQFSWNNEWEAWRRWREAVESLGVLVFQFSKVTPDEMRGISLLDFPLPVVGVNSKEIPASKPFTLLHELAHLMLANAHEERPALEENRPASDWKKVEKYAETVAGAVLMPEPLLLAEPSIRSSQERDSWEIPIVRSLARRFKVTPAALITRLLVLGRCSPSAYHRWKTDWAAYQKEHPALTGGGIALPPEKALNRNGLSFTRLVLEAFSLDRITSTDAANFLGVNFTHVETLRQDLMFVRSPADIHP